MNRLEKIIPAKEQCPVVTASILSKWSFWWLVDLFQKGMKRPLEENEIFQPKSNLVSSKITKKFSKLWDDELKRDHPSVLRLVYRAYGGSVLFWGLSFSVVETLMRLVQPICLGGLVSYFAPGQTHINKEWAYIYASGIILSTLIMVLTFHPFILWIFEIGLRIRIGCSGLLYKKCLRLSKSSTYEGINGTVINIMSNDLSKFELALAFLHDLWKGPMESFLFGYFIYREIGVAGIIGVAFLLCFIPLQAWIGKKSADYRLRTAKRTDFRVKIMNEIISGVQVIKMYAWENSFAAMVNKIRRKEINAIRGTSYVRATLLSFTTISRLSIFLSLVSYVYFGNVITASKVFIVSSFFTILNLSMVYFWPLAITMVAEGYIAATRVQRFLLESENKPGEPNNIVLKRQTAKENSKNYNKKIVVPSEKFDKNIKFNGSNMVITDEVTELLSRRTENTDNKYSGVHLVNATAVWERKENEKTPGIHDINLKIDRAQLCAVIGPVGSGKSTLLNVIVGELNLDNGFITIDGRISYASQEPWLFEGSVRSNILFVEEFDAERYREVVHVCALERDFQLLAHGDATIVGERGISLSGGQKARINLARAIYKKADIYLLDDPLSAVDTHVGKHIFEKCIEDFLNDKICILVTHQIQYLKHVSDIVFMSGGRIEAQGSYTELKKNKRDIFTSQTSLEDKDNKPHKEKINESNVLTNNVKSGVADDAEDRKEYQAIGSVSFDVYKSFFKAVHNKYYIIYTALLFFLAQAALSAIDFYVAQWSNWEQTIAIENVEKNLTIKRDVFNNLTNQNVTNGPLNDTTVLATDTTENEIRQQYIIFYSALTGIGLILFLNRTFTFFKLCLRVSINLHDKLFMGISRATMHFFNTNPSGRILNRFSKDIFGIDTMIPPALIDCLSFFLELTAIIIIIAIVNYWLIVPTLFMVILFYLIRVFYINTSRSIKRIDSLTRSPIYSHTNATLQGLPIIRAFRAQEIVEKEYHEYYDHNTSAWYLFITTNRAFALWLDLVCLVYITIVTLSFLVIGQSTMGGNVGLAITQCVSLIGMCQWGMRQTADLENHMTSVERVLEYADLPAEPPLESDENNKPPKTWPTTGIIQFKNLNLKYSEHSDYVLKDVTLQINDKEKIGIVGRTGAGKSSMIQAMFRLAINDGAIIVDNIDTNTLGLHDLRNKISIIPQDPVLFSGSLRFNLDPFDERTDEALWNALEQVELRNVVSAMSGGLDCKMLDGGSNFSMGQRQLVCLARAILRNNRILILDEATANVDQETDKLIQRTIRQQFANCTVLTIAHRLHTVMDSDRVLVVDAGRIVEFAHPHELLQIPDGHLRKFVDESENSTALKLFSIAEKNYLELNEKTQQTSSEI